MSTRNSSTLNSSATVRHSVDNGTARCAEGGLTVLVGVGLCTACGASRAGSKSDVDRSAGPLPLAIRGRYTDSTCKKSFMSNVAARTDLSMCAWRRTLSMTPYTARLNIWYKFRTHRQNQNKRIGILESRIPVWHNVSSLLAHGRAQVTLRAHEKLRALKTAYVHAHQ